MSYKVLYRKYRPTKFKEIIGQKSIVDNLQNSVEKGNFSHAYMFTGPRGTGKTSTAKVLAKAINCSNCKNGEICGECASCKNFSTSPDIIEIDAASNNGVDEIRELRTNITHAPASSKFKIYIIDEVHMLSPGAFNALLKTLEEPPEHAIFILATTEVYKVPITILSRCQRYDFRKIEKNTLIEYLKEICKKEKIEFEDEAIEEIYSLSEGCLRDALSILDQVSKTEEKITLSSILKSYNIISSNSIKTLLDDVAIGNAGGIISKIEEFEDSGMNPQKFLKKIINYLEKLAIDIKMKKETKYQFNIISQLIKKLNECYIDARINENVFTMIKLSFLDVINDTDSKVPKERTSSKQETKSTSKMSAQTLSAKDEKQEANDSISMEEMTPKTIPQIRINNCFAGANKESLKNLTDLWNGLDKNKLTAVNIEDYRPVAASSDYAIFTADESSLADLFNIKKELIEKHLKKNKIVIKIVALTEKTWQKEKQEYIKKKKSGQTYCLINEPPTEDDTSEIKGQLGDLFTEKIVEIS